MQRRLSMAPVVTMMALVLGTVAGAQKTTELKVGGGGSPHVKTDWTIDGANISIEYGRPFLKGRPEADLMPVGKPWRTGADEATLLTTDKPLKIGSLTLKPGTYTINTQPGEKEWHLLIGTPAAATERRPKPWGIPYNPQLEIGRVPMAIGKASAPVEQVSIFVDDTSSGATLRIEWGTASATVPFTVG
jgi:hypothetical protein